MGFLLGRTSIHQLGNQFTEHAGRLQTLKTDVEVPRGRDAAMTEHAPNQGGKQRAKPRQRAIAPVTISMKLASP
jgi:hypothetical protein